MYDVLTRLQSPPVCSSRHRALKLSRLLLLFLGSLRVFYILPARRSNLPARCSRANFRVSEQPIGVFRVTGIRRGIPVSGERKPERPVPAGVCQRKHQRGNSNSGDVEITVGSARTTHRLANSRGPYHLPLPLLYPSPTIWSPVTPLSTVCSRFSLRWVLRASIASFLSQGPHGFVPSSRHERGNIASRMKNNNAPGGRGATGN